MSDPATSPEVSHEDQDEDQIDEGQVEQEQLDIGDEDPEDIIDEEVDGVGDLEEDEKAEGQEGLDLDVAEEDGISYQDEPDAEMEMKLVDSVHEQVDEGDDIDTKVENVKDITLTHSGEEEMHMGEKGQEEKKIDENTEQLLSRPPHGSEVFVGGISKETVEDDLKELCSPYGDIFEVCILRDKDKGENKGFAFVTFTNKESAEKAIEMLNNYELKGRKIRFSPSQSKHRLFIGNVPKNWDKDELEKVLAERGPGIEAVELLKDPQNTGRNRGFAFVEFYNHACAENARRNLSLPGFKLGTNVPTVSWADPRSGSDTASLSQVKVVYVSNLPEDATQEQLRKLFEHHGEITKVVIPPPKPGQPKRNFGFIHFANRSSALTAIEKTERYELEGRELERNLAKPPPEKRPGTLESSYLSYQAGRLPQYQASAGYGYPGSGMYGAVGAGYGSSRGYEQPVIYGRGPAPPGMTMVPMMLPDGRVGYVLQQPGGQGAPPPHRDNRSGRLLQSQRQGPGTGGSSRRYRPY